MKKIIDHKSYALISIQSNNKKIKLQYIQEKPGSQACLFFMEATSQQLQDNLINNKTVLFSFNKMHYAYVVLELFKAEICLKMNQPYIQS